MKIRQAALLIVLAGFIGSGIIAEAQQATIRPSPQAPLQPNPQSQAEQDAYFTVQNAATPLDRLREASNFLSDYFASEYRHLVLYQDWLARGELQRNPEEIIEAALNAIEAQNHFLTSKLSFIDDPSRLPQLLGVQFTLKNREGLFYQSIVGAYDTEGDWDRVVEYADLALGAQREARGMLDGAVEAGTPEYDQAVDQIELGQMFVLNTLLEGYREREDLDKVVETGQALLEVNPEDLNTLMLVSLIMSDRPPQDQAAARAHWERTRDYAAEGVRQLNLFLESPEAAQVTDEQKAGFIAEVNTTLGMASLQIEEFADAVDAFQTAADAAPDPNVYYMLAVAAQGSRDADTMMSALARAVYLEHPDPQIRASLTAMFEALNGSTEGLDAFIESEGAQIN